MPKSMRVILAVLLLAIPVAWWSLRAASEEPSAPGRPPAPARPVPSSTSIPRAPAPPEEPPDDGMEEAEDEDTAEELLEDDEEELAGPGPCIQIEVTAQGAPVPDARVDAAMYEDDSYFTLSPIRVGPEGRRQAWCKPGKYLLGARAPGFAPSFMELVVAAGGAPPLARFQLGAGLTLSGVVLDKDSQGPIARARLTLSRSDDFEFVMDEESSATSDERGIFQLSALAEGTYSIEVTAPGHSSLDKEVVVPRAETLTLELEGTARLEGQVITSAGAPVPGARIEVIESGLEDKDSPTLTDAQGRFSVEVEEGTWRVMAKHQGQAGQHEGAVTVARGGLVDGLVITLRPGGTLSGTVVASSTQEPLERATLTLQDSQSDWIGFTRTEAGGGFRFEQLLPGEYSLSVAMRGFPEVERENLRVEVGQELSVRIALTRQSIVEGAVTDAMGRPAADGIVYAQPLGEPVNGPKRTSASVDEDGRYLLGPLLPGSYEIEARLTAFGKPISRELTLAEGETAQVDFSLPDAQGQVEGVVQREGGGRPDLPVEVLISSGPQRLWFETDETGHFSAQLLPGRYTLSAVYSGMDEGGPEETVIVEAGKRSRVTLTVPGSVTETSGIVLNARGEPDPDAMVALSSNNDEELSASTSTDARGRFTLRTPLETAGTLVSITADDEAEHGEVQNVRAGSHDVVVRLERAAALRGRVIAARGPPVQGFALEVDQSDDGSFPNFSAEDASPFLGDSFELVDEAPGAYYLLVRTSDGRSGMARVKLVAGQTTAVELAVGVLGRITGRVVNDGLHPHYQVRRVILDDGTPREQAAEVDEDGRFELSAVEPGAHSLQLDMHDTLSIHLREGEVLELGELVPKDRTATSPTP